MKLFFSYQNYLFTHTHILEHLSSDPRIHETWQYSYLIICLSSGLRRLNNATIQSTLKISSVFTTDLIDIYNNVSKYILIPYCSNSKVIRIFESLTNSIVNETYVSEQSFSKDILLFLRVIAHKRRPNSARPCSIDVSDFADIFTVDRSNKVRNIPKISAHLNKPFRRYRRYKYGCIQYIGYIFYR